jgi:hypothetical protein
MIQSSTSVEALTIPLEELSEAQVRIGFGGGELSLQPAAPGVLVSGTFEGGVIRRDVGPGSVYLEQEDPRRAALTGCKLHWDVRLTAEVPVDLRLDTGANKSNVDLSALRIRRLEVHTGASDSEIRLPTSGQTAVRVECGLAQVVLAVPEGIAAHIRGKIALGSTEVDTRRFPRADDGWQSPDYALAADRVDIEIRGGLGTVRVV